MKIPRPHGILLAGPVTRLPYPMITPNDEHHDDVQGTLALYGDCTCLADDGVEYSIKYARHLYISAPARPPRPSPERVSSNFVRVSVLNSSYIIQTQKKSNRYSTMIGYLAARLGLRLTLSVISCLSFETCDVSDMLCRRCHSLVTCEHQFRPFFGCRACFWPRKRRAIDYLLMSCIDRALQSWEATWCSVE